MTRSDQPPPDGPAELLAAAVDRAGNRPLPWLAAPLQNARRVLELCCGTGLLAGQLRPGRWLGVATDLEAETPTAGTGRDAHGSAEPDAAGPDRTAPLLRAVPHRIPLRANAVDGVALLLALPLLPHLDAVFAELRRVLRPGGTLVVGVPSAGAASFGELRVSRMLRPVHAAWTNRSALDRAGWLLAAADFAVLGDDRVPFALPLPDAAAALALAERLPAARLWPPGLPEDVRAAAAAGLARVSGPDRVLPVPLRRLVARR